MRGNIIRPQFGPKPPVTTDEYFGGCPECGKTDGYVNSGVDHWFACDAHRARWYVGSNLFSVPDDYVPSQEDIAHTAKVMSYREVEPVKMPLTPCDVPVTIIRTPRGFALALDELMTSIEGQP